MDATAGRVTSFGHRDESGGHTVILDALEQEMTSKNTTAVVMVMGGMAGVAGAATCLWTQSKIPLLLSILTLALVAALAGALGWLGWIVWQEGREGGPADRRIGREAAPARTVLGALA